MSKAATKEVKAPLSPPDAPTAPAGAASSGSAEAGAVPPVPPASLTSQEVEELRLSAAKAQEHWDRLLRTTADFDNFRKRAAREKQDAIKYANESLLSRLLPVLDSLDAALAATDAASDKTADALRTGVGLVQQQFKAVLAEAGVEEVNAAGQPFDPHVHEAVAQHECAETPEGHVMQQLRKGYKLRDRLLRPASVIVAKQPAASKADVAAAQTPL